MLALILEMMVPSLRRCLTPIVAKRKADVRPDFRLIPNPERSLSDCSVWAPSNGDEPVLAKKAHTPQESCGGGKLKSVTRKQQGVWLLIDTSRSVCVGNYGPRYLRK